MHYYLIVNKKTGKPYTIHDTSKLYRLKKEATFYKDFLGGFKANTYEVRKFKIEEVE